MRNMEMPKTICLEKPIPDVPFAQSLFGTGLVPLDTRLEIYGWLKYLWGARDIKSQNPLEGQRVR